MTRVGFVLFATLALMLAVARVAKADISLATYCTDLAANDHSACINAWIEAGRDAPNQRLYAPAGTYRYSGSIDMYSHMKLECAGPDETVFKNVGGSGTFLKASTHVTNIEIRNCAFDVNGNATNFLAVISVNPQADTQTSSNIRVRKNRIFDSQFASYVPTDLNQRQFILLMNCQQCRVEDNHLSGGGRIKVGRPGRGLHIGQNTVEQANDNAITIADTTGGITQDAVIEKNRIINPRRIGIYFGGDSDGTKWPAMVARRVRITENYIEGNWEQACIFGRLPFTADDIRIQRNQCVKTGITANGTAGIRIKRTCEAAAPATEIRIERNRISSTLASGTALDFGGVSFAGIHRNVQVTRNSIRSVGPRAMLFRYVAMTSTTVKDNELVGGAFVIEGSVSGELQANTASPSGATVPEACTPTPSAARLRWRGA